MAWYNFFRKNKQPHIEEHVFHAAAPHIHHVATSGVVIDHAAIMPPPSSRHLHSARPEQDQMNGSRLPRLPIPGFNNAIPAAQQVQDRDPEQPEPEACELPLVCSRAGENVLDQRIAAYINNLHTRLGIRMPEPESQDTSTTDAEEEKKKYKGHELNRDDRFILTAIITVALAFQNGVQSADTVYNNENTEDAVVFMPGALLLVSLVPIFIYFCFDKPRDTDDNRRNCCTRWFSRPLTLIGLLFFSVALVALIFNSIVFSLADRRLETVNNTVVTVTNEVPSILSALSFVLTYGCFIIPYAFQILSTVFAELISFYYMSELKDTIRKHAVEIERCKNEKKDLRNQLFSEIILLNEELKAEKKDTTHLEQKICQLYDHLEYHHKGYPRSRSHPIRENGASAAAEHTTARPAVAESARAPQSARVAHSGRTTARV